MRSMMIAAAAGLVLAVAGAAGAQAQTPLWQSVKEPTQLAPPRATGRQRVGDVELYYEVYGQGRPVVLLHDALGNTGHWGNQVGPLSVDYKVVVIDSRGHGRSTRGDKPFSYRVMAEDVFGLMRKLGLEDTVVVGWGDGAIVGLELAMRHPGWVKKLVMFGGNYDLSGLKPGAQETETFAAYARKSVADYKTLSPAPDFDALFADLRVMWKKEPAYTPAQLRKVRPAVAIVIAEHDEIVKLEHSQELIRLLPQAQVVTLPGVSHFAPWQDPRRFNDAVRFTLD